VCLVDTTNVLTQLSTILDLRAREHSDYLQHQAVKFFAIVSISRSGRFIALDSPYAPETSDSLILLEQLKTGYPLRSFLEQGFPLVDESTESRLIAADRGFLNTDEVLRELVSLLWDSISGDESELANLLQFLAVTDESSSAPHDINED